MQDSYKRMFDGLSLVRAETAAGEHALEDVAVVARRFSLPQPEDVGEARRTGTSATPKDVSNDDFRTTRNRTNNVMPAPTPPTSHQKRPPSNPQVRPLESEAALVSVRRSSVFMVARGGEWRVLARSKVADADAAVRVDAEDFVERKDDRRCSRDDRPADDATSCPGPRRRAGWRSRRR